MIRQDRGVKAASCRRRHVVPQRRQGEAHDARISTEGRKRHQASAQRSTHPESAWWGLDGIHVKAGLLRPCSSPIVDIVPGTRSTEELDRASVIISKVVDGRCMFWQCDWIKTSVDMVQYLGPDAVSRISRDPYIN